MQCCNASRVLMSVATPGTICKDARDIQFFKFQEMVDSVNVPQGMSLLLAANGKCSMLPYYFLRAIAIEHIAF